MERKQIDHDGSMNKALSDQQIEQFRDQGFLAGLRVWDDNTVERAQSHFRQ
jgi:hypothetical protein